jgi:hypothetical protein
MRTALIPVCRATILILGLAATCGCGPSHPAKDATSAEEAIDTTPTGEKLTPEQVAEKRRQRQQRFEEDAARDPDTKKGAGPVDCDIKSTMVELLDILSRPACEVHDSDAATNEKDLTDVLTVKATTDSSTIAPGGQAKITVIFSNKGKTPLPLDFKLDPEPRFLLEVYTPKGNRAELPPGQEPMLPESTGGPSFEPSVARITLAPGSSGRVIVTWNSVKYKWAAKEKARGAVRGHGYPREPSGLLPKGKYVVRVVTPLMGVFEGVEHTMSQPSVPVEVKD